MSLVDEKTFAPYLARQRQWLKKQWQKKLRFEVVLVCMMVLLFATALWAVGRQKDAITTMNFLFDNLPLTLPVLTVVLTVLLRPLELTVFEGWLRLATPFGLGLVSFAIWAYVAGQSVEQYIVINSTKVLNKNHALLLVIISFILASFYSTVAALAESSAKKRWRVIQAAQLAFSCALLTVPFFLFEDKTAVETAIGHSLDERLFTVDIPYRDAYLNSYLGASANPITQCFWVQHMKAKSPSEAIKKARETMTGMNIPIQKGRPTTAPPVEVVESLIVAQEER